MADDLLRFGFEQGQLKPTGGHDNEPQSARFSANEPGAFVLNTYKSILWMVLYMGKKVAAALGGDVCRMGNATRLKGFGRYKHPDAHTNQR